MEVVDCRRCSEEKEALATAPFRGERGARIRSRICKGCWAEWLQHQTLLINHYGLDPRDRKSRDFLYAQIDEVLLGDADAEQIDFSKEGTIKW